MKKIICMLLCLVLCVGLFAACGEKQPAPSPTATPTVSTPPSGPTELEYYDELSLYILDKVAIIDAFNPGAQSTANGIYGHMLYDTLVYCNLDNEYVPCLATEWSSEDNKTFNFKLREGVKYHNGETFTADDIAFTIDKAKDAPGTHIYDRFNQVESYEIVNEYEINLTLRSVNVDFIFDISQPIAPILNREAYENDPEKGPWVGTGPFYLDKLVPNDSLTLVAFEDYWGEKPLCKKFVMRHIAEETARLIMLENDEFTFCDIGSVYIPQFENNPKFVIYSYVMNNLNYIAFNMRKPITGDKNFRMAVAHTIDREAILDIALDGYGEIAETGALWGYKTAYKNMDLPLIERDLDKAKEYLEKSIYNGETIEITASLPHTINSAQVIMAQLSEIGINTELNRLDAPSMASATAYDNNDTDIVVGSGAWTPMASSCRSFLTPGHNSNKAVYDNPEIVQLIEEAAATSDGPDREALYYRIQEILADDIPYLGTFHMALYIGAQKGAGGAAYFPTNYHDYALAYRIKNPQ
ncbi:MAG: ABC transporter substrate-binding protein [Clostridiales bacterium]|nr:ABC transporter substrate-binding protein [Clostridiales bacterium]